MGCFRLVYVLTNMIDESASLFARVPDSSPYVLENVYNERPSLPYRTEGIGAVGDPEYICIEFAAAKNPTFVGIFNHNLTHLDAGGDELRLKACVDICGSGGCDWDNPDKEVDLTVMTCTGTQPIPNFRNTYRLFDVGSYQYWRVDAIDQNNTVGHLDFGELVLGTSQVFHKGVVSGDPNWVRLSPGRDDGPWFFTGEQKTHYGQDWYNFYSTCERFVLTFTNINDPCIVDELHVFLKNVMEAHGIFILIPDDDMPFCYYVKVENLRDFASRLMYGCDRELREWKLELKTLTEGIFMI